MKKFRRSTKSSDKTDSFGSGKPLFVPQKDAIAIVPPKKVIKALYDYQAPADQRHDYLSFATGDFLHVVAREHDTDWYEACNPLHNTRGLVPVNHFEEVGKQHARGGSTATTTTTATSNGLASPPISAHDSGFSEKDGLRSSKLGRGIAGTGTNGAMVYGIVQYDFCAERADELDAKAGEAIIVIAQSNSEWFVAKPIQRLGGPGLIPVSFIEIRDMTTGQPVVDAVDAVQRAGVPRVEEWKRMAAEYKNSSIPLGTLGQMGGGGGGGQSTTSLGQSMQRLSIGSARQSHATTTPNESHQHQRAHSQTRTASAAQSPPSAPNNDQRWSQLPAPLRARVTRYTHHKDEFWFIVEAQLENQRHWDLYRNYKDFYALQLALKDSFPAAAGMVHNVKRTLPLMPGPVPWVSEHITQERRAHLDTYLVEMLRCSADIIASWPVKQFFAPRPEDVPVHERPDSSDTDYRHSGTSSQHSTNLDSHNSSAGNVSMSTASTYNTSPSRLQQSPYGNQALSQQQQSAKQQAQNHYRQPSDLRVPSSNTTATSPAVYRSNNNNSINSNPAVSSNVSVQSQAPAKVKVWFGDASCVIIRLPPAYGFHDVMQKLKERWDAGEAVNNGASPNAPFEVEWRDEDQGSYHRMSNDQELQVARRSRDRVTLRVRPA